MKQSSMREISDMLTFLSYPVKVPFLNLYNKVVGIPLREWPASTKYHHAWRGGLYDHTKEVMNMAYEIYYNEDGLALGITKDDVIISAFIHDLDKLDKYVQDPSMPSGFNYKQDDLAVSAVAKTVSLLGSHGITLTNQQLNALTFAEGGWSIEARGNPKAQPGPLAVIIHMADLYSTYFYGAKK